MPTKREERDERHRGEPIVILEGGPRHGWAYWLSDIEAQRDSTEYFDRPFDYAPTADPTIWLWTPTRRVAAPEPQIESAADLREARCPTCSEPVRRAQGRDALLTLDAEPHAGGVFEFDERGSAVRRPLREIRELTGSGYDIHECRILPPSRGPD